jgi:branched-chain amino acid transport system permease protein
MTENIAINPDRPSLRLLELLIIAAGFGGLTLILSAHWVIDFMMFCILVISFDLLYGYMGHLSFGVMLYYGTGAYATALWLALGSENALAAISVGMGVTVAVAGLLGAIAIRTSGAAFALINMAFNEIGFFMVHSALKDYTNGDDGLAVTAQPLFGFIDFYNETSVYLLILGVVLAVYWVLKKLMGSPYGTLVRAIHENEDRVKFLGYNTLRTKWLTFVISSGLAGLAGSLFACVRGFISPELMSPFGNVELVFAVLIGGAGYLYGSLVGGLVFMLIKNYLPIWVSKANNLLPFTMPQWELWLGVVLLIIVFAWRKGIVGLVKIKMADRRAWSAQGGPR